MQKNDPDILNAKRRLMPLGPQDEHMIENVCLPSGLHRAHVTNPHADPKIEDWQHLIPLGVQPGGIWAYTDSQGMHHLVITWREMLQEPLI